MGRRLVEAEGWVNNTTYSVRRIVRPGRDVERASQKPLANMAKSGFHLSHPWPLRWGGREAGGLMYAHGRELNLSLIARMEGAIGGVSRLAEHATAAGHRVWVTVEVTRYEELNLNLLEEAHYQIELEFADGSTRLVGGVTIPQNIPEAQRRLLAAGNVVEVDRARLGMPSGELVNPEALDQFVEAIRAKGRQRGSRSKDTGGRTPAPSPETPEVARRRVEVESRPRETEIVGDRGTAVEQRGIGAAASPTPGSSRRPPRTVKTGATTVPRLKPTVGSTARKAARHLLPTSPWDIGTLLLDIVLSQFKAVLARVNQEQTRRAFREAVKPIEADVARIWGLLDADPTLVTSRGPVHYYFRWRVVMEIQATDIADAAVLAASFVLLRPGFAEVFQQVEVFVPRQPDLRAAAAPRRDPERRARKSGNLVDYTHISSILILHPRVSRLLDTLVAARREAEDLVVVANSAIARLRSTSRSLSWKLVGVSLAIRAEDYASANAGATELLQALFDLPGDPGWEARQAVFDLANSCAASAAAVASQYSGMNAEQRALMSARSPGFPPVPVEAPQVFRDALWLRDNS